MVKRSNFKSSIGLVLITIGLVVALQALSLFSRHSYYADEAGDAVKELISAIETEDSGSYYYSLVSIAMAMEGFRSGESPYAALTGCTTARLYQLGEDLCIDLSQHDVSEAIELVELLKIYQESLFVFLSKPFIPIFQLFLVITGIILIITEKRKKRKNDE